MKKTALLFVIFLGVLLCAVGYSDTLNRTSVGHEAPALSLSRGDSAVSLEDLRGHYVLLNFWSSTDALSRRNANLYTAWKRHNPGTNLELLGVNFDKSPALFREIARRDSLIPETQFHVAGDTARAVSDIYGLRGGYGSLLIGPDGDIVLHNPTDAQLSAILTHRGRS